MYLSWRSKSREKFSGLEYCYSSEDREAVFNHFPTDPGDVYFVELEDGRKRTKKRLEQINYDWEAFDNTITFLFEYQMKNGNIIDHLEKWISKARDPKLIVIDNLAKVRNKKSSGYDYYADYNDLSPFQEFANKHGITVLVIHHTNKGDHDDLQRKISGTVAVAGVANTIMLLEKKKGTFVLSAFSKDLENNHSLALHRNDKGTYEYQGEAEQILLSKTQQSILQELQKAEGPLTPIDLAQILNIPPGTVKSGLYRLERKGKVQKLERGQYIVPLSMPKSLLSSTLDDSEDLPFC